MRKISKSVNISVINTVNFWKIYTTNFFGLIFWKYYVKISFRCRFKWSWLTDAFGCFMQKFNFLSNFDPTWLHKFNSMNFFQIPKRAELFFCCFWLKTKAPHCFYVFSVLFSFLLCYFSFEFPSVFSCVRPPTVKWPYKLIIQYTVDRQTKNSIPLSKMTNLSSESELIL